MTPEQRAADVMADRIRAPRVSKICRCREDAVDAFGELHGYNWGEALKITIAKEPRRRTLKQNGRFHSWCEIIAEHLGYERWEIDRVKEDLKDICDCPWYEYRSIDGTMRRRRSTAHLDTRQMMDFEERILRFAAKDLGIALPVTKEDFARMKEQESAHAG